MKAKDIKIGWVRRHTQIAPFYGINEIDSIELHPQLPEPGCALKPEAQVVIENTNRNFIVILLAKHVDGLIYSDYEAFTRTGCAGGYPTPGRDPGRRTIRGTLKATLERLRRYKVYADDRTEWINRIVDRTLQEINKGSLRQMSIFDML